MKIKEMIAYIFGLVIILYGAFGGKNLSSMDDIIEGIALLFFFISVYVVYLYMNKRGVGDWNRYDK